MKIQFVYMNVSKTCLTERSATYAFSVVILDALSKQKTNCDKKARKLIEILQKDVGAVTFELNNRNI